jgi:NADH:ubiquinone oxidoreductase subunit E
LRVAHRAIHDSRMRLLPASPTFHGWMQPCSTKLAAAAPDVSRVLVCVGTLCECQEGIGARALLRELRALPALDETTIEETVCLGMCGMGAMGCVEYVDGSETLVHGRDQMLDELGVDPSLTAAQEECALTTTRMEAERIMVCTGTVCERLDGGGSELLQQLQQQSLPIPLEAAPCLGCCGKSPQVCVVDAAGCETTLPGLDAALAHLEMSAK